MALELSILTTSETLMSGSVDLVVIPSVSGEAGVLPQHTQYLTLLGAGKLSYKQGDRQEEFNITGGLARVEGDRMVILVDSLLANLNHIER